MPLRSHGYVRLYHGGVQGKDDDPVTVRVRQIICEKSLEHVGSIGLDNFELMMENVNNQHEEEVFKVLDPNLQLERITIPGDRVVEGKVRGIAFRVCITFDGCRVSREYATTCYEIELIRFRLDIIYQRESADNAQTQPLTQVAQPSGA